MPTCTHVFINKLNNWLCDPWFNWYCYTGSSYQFVANTKLLHVSFLVSNDTKITSLPILLYLPLFVLYPKQQRQITNNIQISYFTIQLLWCSPQCQNNNVLYAIISRNIMVVLLAYEMGTIPLIPLILGIRWCQQNSDYL